MGVAAFAAAPTVLQLMDTHPDIMADATTYMRVSCLGVPLIAVYNYTSSMLRSLGDSRTPLYFLICSCFLNLALDVLFVNRFHMGVFGAALATIIAQLASGVGCLIYALKYNPYFRLSREDLQPDRLLIGKAVKIGLPMAFQWSLISISSTALQTFVNSFESTDVVAAYTATNRIESLLHQPYGSISAALATFSGQNYGARNLDRVKNGLKHAFLIAGVYTLLMTLLFQLFSTPIMHLYRQRGGGHQHGCASPAAHQPVFHFPRPHLHQSRRSQRCGRRPLRAHQRRGGGYLPHHPAFADRADSRRWLLGYLVDRGHHLGHQCFVLSVALHLLAAPCQHRHLTVFRKQSPQDRITDHSAKRNVKAVPPEKEARLFHAVALDEPETASHSGRHVMSKRRSVRECLSQGEAEAISRQVERLIDPITR